MRGLIIIGILFTSLQLCGQIDSTDQVQLEVNQDAVRSPKKALLYSIFVPGGGQIYNKQYLKLPFLYGGYAFFLNQATTRRADFLCHQDALQLLLDPDEVVPAPFNCRGSTYDFGNFTAAGLRTGRDNNRQSMELNFIFLSLLHIASIIDAYVYAHLDSFDSDDDLSIRLISPDELQAYPTPFQTPRLGLVYSF